MVDSVAGFRTEKIEPGVPYGLLKAARKSGHLDLSGRDLSEGNAVFTVLESAYLMAVADLAI